MRNRSWKLETESDEPSAIDVAATIKVGLGGFSPKRLGSRLEAKPARSGGRDAVGEMTRQTSSPTKSTKNSTKFPKFPKQM